MRIIFIVLFIISFAIATQWQIPTCLGIYIDAPSFSADNLRMYCDIYYSIYHSDIAYYEWNGSQWVYIARVQGDVNTTDDEYEPFVTYDNQKLYFERTSSSSSQPHYLYVADWDGSGFINSRALNSQINSADCRYPSITQDGSKLYFARSVTPNGRKIFEATWNGSDWINPIMLPVEVNGSDSHNKDMVTISPDGNEIYFRGAGSYYLWLAYSHKVGGVWQQWQYCDSNINLTGCSIMSEALTYAPYETQVLYFGRSNSPGNLTWHALRSPVSVEPASLGQIKATYR